MATLTKTGSTYQDGTLVTSTIREVPGIPGISAMTGTASGISVTLPFRIGTIQTLSYTVYVFKTFNSPGDSYWQKRNNNNNWYQYDPAKGGGNTKYYLVTDYLSDILATGTFSEQITTTNFTKTLTLTDYGKSLANWGGTVYIGVIASSTALLWNYGQTVSMTLTYTQSTATSSRVGYGKDNTYKNCEVYYGTGNQYVKVDVYYGYGGSWKKISTT